MPEKRSMVDMSPAAVAERIATVGQLYRVCMSLMQARPLDRRPADASSPPEGQPDAAAAASVKPAPR